MITGSHNAAEYNGFKLGVGPTTIHGAEIQRLREIIERRDFVTTGARGSLSERPVIPDYNDFIMSQFKLKPGMKVVVDGGNGCGGVIAAPLMKRLGLDTIELYTEMDGRFPNHHPDPTVEENMRDLIAAVKKNHAAIGIAYDGDADRVGAVDENGKIVWGDELMVAFSRAILRERPGATFIGEVKCSKRMYDDIARNGGRPIMWKTGHSLIKSKLKEEHAALAGEMSGHMFFADRYFGFDDGIYASFRLLEILSKEGRGLGAILADLPAESLHAGDSRRLSRRSQIRSGAQGGGVFSQALRSDRYRRCARKFRRRLGTRARVEHATRAGDAVRSDQRKATG